MTEVLAFSENPLSLLPALQRAFGWFAPMRRFNRDAARADELVYELVEERRAAERAGEPPGDDVLAMLLAARHEDGTPMSPRELRDELMTALAAGHETTASQLAWGFERLAREPEVASRLISELEAGTGDEYLTATIYEILRRRPVLPNAEPRLVKRPVTIGPIEYPAGVALLASAYLVHHDPDVYPDPYAFRPERFLGTAPGTYTWIPFGGGRRRCLGASFALQEMKIVLRAVLSRYEVTPATTARERTGRRSITFSPSRGATVVLRERRARINVSRDSLHDVVDLMMPISPLDRPRTPHTQPFGA
jgi:cytochrome P450